MNQTNIILSLTISSIVCVAILALFDIDNIFMILLVVFSAYPMSYPISKLISKLTNT